MVFILRIVLTGCTSEEDETFRPLFLSSQIANGVSAITTKQGLTEADI